MDQPRETCRDEVRLMQRAACGIAARKDGGVLFEKCPERAVTAKRRTPNGKTLRSFDHRVTEIKLRRIDQLGHRFGTGLAGEQSRMGKSAR